MGNWGTARLISKRLQALFCKPEWTHEELHWQVEQARSRVCVWADGILYVKATKKSQNTIKSFYFIDAYDSLKASTHSTLPHT